MITNLEVAPAPLDADVRVPGEVLDGAVVHLPRVGLVLQVDAAPLVLGHEPEVDEEDVPLLCK